MALRFLEVRLPRTVRDEAAGLADAYPVIDRWCVPSGDDDLHEFLLESQEVEPLVDALRSRFGDDRRIIVMPVEATLPRLPEPETPDLIEPAEEAKVAKPARGRVSREELYEDLNDGIALTPTFLMFAGLSAVVATMGLLRDDQVAIIGAMVIAPLLGPNMAIALGTTLADFQLLRASLKSGAAGIGLSFLVAFAIGWFMPLPDPLPDEIVARIGPDLGHLALAMASGVAGGLAFTTGAPASLIGVMVAVALLPPLATGAILLAAGRPQDSIGAFVLLGTNLVAVNLAGIATFLAQGIRPLWRSEQDAARRAARNALLLWGLLLIAFGYALTQIERPF